MTYAPIPAAFQRASMKETFDSRQSQSVDSDLDKSTRFLTSVVKGLHAYLANNRDNPLRVESVFYLANKPRDFPSIGQQGRLFRDGLVRVESAIVFSNVDANRIDVHNLSHELDRHLVEYEDHAILGHRPTITVVPTGETTRITYYPNGMSPVDAPFKEYELETVASVSSEKVREAVHRLYEATFRIPGGINSSVAVWSDAAKLKPVKDAEKFIQGHIRSTLVNAFPGVSTVEEIHTSTGRFDLALRDGAKYLGIVELKVMRKGQASLVTTTFGVNQAYAYRVATAADWSRLICFDMRGGLENNDLHEKVRVRALKLSVPIDSFHVYSKAEDFRTDLADSAVQAV